MSLKTGKLLGLDSVCQAEAEATASSPKKPKSGSSPAKPSVSPLATPPPKLSAATEAMAADEGAEDGDSAALGTGPSASPHPEVAVDPTVKQRLRELIVSHETLGAGFAELAYHISKDTQALLVHSAFLALSDGAQGRSVTLSNDPHKLLLCGCQGSEIMQLHVARALARELHANFLHVDELSWSRELPSHGSTTIRLSGGVSPTPVMLLSRDSATGWTGGGGWADDSDGDTGDDLLTRRPAPESSKWQKGGTWMGAEMDSC